MEINIKWNMCLVCLAESDNVIITMKSIYEKDLENVELLEKIMSCGGIEINENENLPSHICEKCVSDLDVAFKFRANCQKSNVYLKSVLEKTKSACASVKFPKTKLHEYESDNVESIEEFIVQSPNDEVKVKDEFFQIDYLEDGSLDNIEQDICNEYVSNDDIHSYKIVSEDEEDVDGISDNSEVIEETSVVNDLSEQDDPIVEHFIRPVTYKRKVIGKESLPFICDVCGNNYSKRTQLTTHMKTHLMVKPYECEICQKKFSMSCNLLAHIRIHTGEKPYVCKYCDRKFTNRSTHLKHERVHTNERPFMCTECGKSFSYSTSLKAHLKIHTGEKAYKCAPCSKMFALPHQLKAHLKTITHRELLKNKSFLNTVKNEEY